MSNGEKEPWEEEMERAEEIVKYRVQIPDRIQGNLPRITYIGTICVCTSIAFSLSLPSILSSKPLFTPKRPILQIEDETHAPIGFGSVSSWEAGVSFTKSFSRMADIPKAMVIPMAMISSNTSMHR